ELALPERVADYSACGAAGLIVADRQKPAGCRADAEDVEERARDPESACHAYRAAFGEIEFLCAPRKRAAKGLLAVPKLLPDRVGDALVPAREVAACAAEIRDADLDKLLGLWNRQGAQTHGVQQLKERRVGPDPEGERQDGDDRKPRVAEEETRTVSKILE